MKKHTKSLGIPQPVVDEMERLVAISPLLSPTLGWPKVKGLITVQTRMDVKFPTKVDERIGKVSEPWGGPETDPELRLEINRAMKGILDETEKFQAAALKPLGWKLSHGARGNAHHHATLWTKNGKQIAILSYLPKTLPTVIWTIRKKSKTLPTVIWTIRKKSKGSIPRRNLLAFCYASNVVFALAARKDSEQALREVSLSLGKRLRHTPVTSRSPKAIRAAAGAPCETTGDLPCGLPEIHIRRAEGTRELPPQHQQLLEQLIGRVRVVDYTDTNLQYRNTGILSLGDGTPDLLAERNRPFTAELEFPGSIRLAAYKHFDELAWTENFGGNDTVPASTIKRLLATTHTWNATAQPETHAIYRSLEALK